MPNVLKHESERATGHAEFVRISTGPADPEVPTVLIVDDDAACRRILGATLIHLGYRPLEAKDSVSAVEDFVQFKPDLVILDMLMPDKDGIEVIQALRHLDPAARILVVSGGGLLSAESCLDIARLLGANAVLEKPFRQSALQEKLITALR